MATSPSLSEPDLVQRLADAAAAAIQNEAAELRREPERVRSIVLDLTLDRRGVVSEGAVYIERCVR
jgi:hypothetical protein